MHVDGYLEINDGSKDVIISDSVNLSSVEVESVLYGHPMVNELRPSSSTAIWIEDEPRPSAMVSMIRCIFRWNSSRSTVPLWSQSNWSEMES